MNAVRFAWLGATRREALCSLVATEITEWSRDWWIQHVDTDVDVHLVDHHGFVTKDHSPYVSKGASGSLALFMGGRRVEGLGHHLAGTVNEDAAGWARQIGEGALQDLSARIFRRAGVNSFEDLRQERASNALGDAELGSCILAIALGRIAFNLAVDRVIADRLVPPQATTIRPALISRHAALGNVPARMEVVMDFGSVNLTQLADLRVGEVLIGDLGLEAPLAVRIEGCEVVAMGHLRRAGGKRSVMLDGLTTKEENKS